MSQVGQRGAAPGGAAFGEGRELRSNGTFLDVGCANGHLMECLERWTAQKGYRLERYGLDISPELIGVARQRLTFVRFCESSIRKSATLLTER
jgi:2-polyprenyl-3-methyl-5-hydroxy-6-metoxy-1,4-benzoquinol methylase